MGLIYIPANLWYHDKPFRTVMIIRMFAAMFSFVAFLLVILLGYGVASHTIMHPAQEFQQKAILEIIYG